MEIKSLKELRKVDERTLKFQPLGLGGRMRPEDAARYQQEVVSHPELVAEIPQPVRDCFERLRTIYAYGVLCYDFFTVAYDQAQLALEYALRERFMEFYDGTVRFRDKSGGLHAVRADTFDGLFGEIAGHLRSRDGGWRLMLRTGEAVRFDGMLDSLMRWARSEGLLRGQRNRMIEPVLKRIRNHVAHGSGYHLQMPGDAARAIGDVAEIINQLWGAPTPGGRLYPAPIRREIQLVGWTKRGDVMAGSVGLSRNDESAELPAASDLHQASLPGGSRSDDWIWVVVRAVPHDEGLKQFDSLFEVTSYPCETLWGPGTIEEAVAWLEAEQPQADEVDTLDRLFLIQYREDCLYLPRRLEIAASLEEADYAGTWYLVRADSTVDAFGHVRRVVAGGTACSATGPCMECAVTTVGAGKWEEVVRLLTHEHAPTAPRLVPDVRVSSGMRWPRYNRILGNGSWELGDE